MRTITLITAATAALALAACGSDDDDGSAAGGTSKPAAAGAAPKPLPEVPGETLGSGAYMTSVFKPGLRLQIPKTSTWRLLDPGQSARHFGLEVLADAPIELTTLGFHRMDVVGDPKRGARTRRDAVKAPADFIRWLQRHPHLEAEKPQDVEIGGVTGRSIDFTVTSVPSRMPDECKEHGGDCVPLFFDQEEPIVYGVGARARFLSLDVGDAPVVVEMLGYPADQFDRVVGLLEPVLRSVRFTSER